MTYSVRQYYRATKVVIFLLMMFVCWHLFVSLLSVSNIIKQKFQDNLTMIQGTTNYIAE